MTARGRVFAVAMGVLLTLLLHSTVVSYHAKRGTALGHQILALGSEAPRADEWARQGLDHCRRADVWSEGGWGLLPTPGLNVQAAWLAKLAGDYVEMESRIRRELDRLSSDASTEAREPLVVGLSEALARQGLHHGETKRAVVVDHEYGSGMTHAGSLIVARVPPAGPRSRARLPFMACTSMYDVYRPSPVPSALPVT